LLVFEVTAAGFTNGFDFWVFCEERNGFEAGVVVSAGFAGCLESG
jgi:hypothetical protein